MAGTRLRTLATGAAAILMLAACTGGAASPSGSAGSSTGTAASPSGTPCATQPAEGLEPTLVVVANGGTFQQGFIKDYFEPFTCATGVKVESVAASFDPEWAKIVADDQSNNVQWDIVDTGPSVPPDKQPYLTDLGTDCASIPNVAKNGASGTCRRYGLVRGFGGLVLAYNILKYGDKPPTSWKDFWDVKDFPGPRSISGSEKIYMLQTALWADGVPPDQIYPMDLDRAFAKLDEIKSSIDYAWTSGDQAQTLWRNEEVTIGASYSGRAVVLQGEGLPVGFAWPGASQDIGGWGILKKAPHPKAAKAFLDFFFRADQDAISRALDFQKITGYDMPLPAVTQAIPASEQKYHAGAPGNWENTVPQDVDWVQKNQQTVTDRWNAWLQTLP
jgi:spermidine/putrescine-binding protein